MGQVATFARSNCARSTARIHHRASRRAGVLRLATGEWLGVETPMNLRHAAALPSK